MKRNFRSLLYFALAYLVTLSVLCRHAVGVSDFSSDLLNGLNRLAVAFESPDFADIFVMIGAFFLIKATGDREERLDWSTAFFSAALSFLLVVAFSFRNYGNMDFFTASAFQYLLSFVCVCGGTIIFYCMIRVFCIYLKAGSVPEKAAEPFVRKNMGKVGFILITISWTVWILLNYPGTDCPDSLRQLSEYLGNEAWSSWQPPLSSLVMGVCFSVGKALWDPNFGVFLYCFLQTLVGAAVFSYSMKKLRKLGAPVPVCMAGIFFFAFTPFWGVFAQWLEKDLLYAEITVLQAVCMVEIVRDRQCTAKQALALTASGILASFLRNNGIYAVVPTLAVLCFWLKSRSRKRMVVSLALTVAFYAGVTRGGYHALGIQGTSVGEALSVPIQQTARYVSLYGDEVTEYEKEVLGRNFHYEGLYNYNPRISDPAKNNLTAGDLPAYFKVWWQMFLKRPGCYLEAYLVKSYGYLAPVEVNTDGWVGSTCFTGGLGVYHPFGGDVAEIPRQFMYMGERWPVLRYLCMPGTYTWLLFIFTFVLMREKVQKSALIMFIPSYVNVLVCTASPLHNSLRYELPVAAVIPLLIGWSCCCLSGPGRQADK